MPYTCGTLVLLLYREQRCPDDSTLFVGDLPQALTGEELHALFDCIAPVCRARVMGNQCYGFVTFQ